MWSFGHVVWPLRDVPIPSEFVYHWICRLICKVFGAQQKRPVFLINNIGVQNIIHSYDELTIHNG